MGLFGILIGFLSAMVAVVVGVFAAFFSVALTFFALLLPLAPVVLVLLAIVWLANGTSRRNVPPASPWPVAPTTGSSTPSPHPHAGRQV